MDIEDKLKDLDQEDLKDLTEESEQAEETSSGENDLPDDSKVAAEDENKDEGDDIEVETEEEGVDEETEDHVDAVYGGLCTIYSYISDYGKSPIVNCLAALRQYTDTNYKTALDHAREVNHTNGKYRKAGTSGEMLKFDLGEDGDVSEYDTIMVNKVVISMLQQYIDDHNIEKMPDLSQVEKDSYIDSIKVLLIIMVACNKYDYFPSLDLPKFAQKWVIDVMQNITDSQDTIFNDWIAYLVKTKNQFVADKCLEVGYEFFKNSKAIDTFCKYFTREEIGKIKKYPEVYETFLEYRDKFNKTSSSITYKSLYPIFDISDDAFGKRKKKVLAEFVNRYSGTTQDPEVAADALKSIFFEHSND